MPARGALTLFHVRGVRVGVDYSWFLVLFLVILWMSSFYDSVVSGNGGASPYVLAVISALAFFGSVLLHELGHAFVARRNGIETSDITLWLFGGVARMSKDADSAGVEFRVAAAGPAVTLSLALLFAGVGVALAGSQQGFLDAMLVRQGADISGGVAVVAWLASINALVLVFNLIPAFPLDGGRIARAIAWRITGERTRATRFAARLGQVFSYIFIAIGILMVFNGALIGGVWLALIGMVLGSSARAGALQSNFEERIGGIVVADVMDPNPVSIPEVTTIETALDEYFLRYRWPWFPVVDAASHFRGLIERGAADSVPELERATQTVGAVLSPDAGGALAVPAGAPLEALLGNDALRRLGAVAAIDEDGTLRGVVTLEDVGRALRDAVAGDGPGPSAPAG